MTDTEQQESGDQWTTHREMSVWKDATSMAPEDSVTEIVIQCWPYNTGDRSDSTETIDVATVMTAFTTLTFLLICITAGIHISTWIWCSGGMGALAVSFFSRTRGVSHIKLGPGGITLEWRVSGNLARKLFVPWRRIERIYMERSRWKQARDFKLCFRDQRGQTHKIRMAQIATRANWLQLVSAIDTWARVKPENLEDVFDRVAISDQDASFTQLWLDALSEPPKRNRLQPLSSGQLLRKGKYTILSQLGAGGQGIAYLASDSANKSVVLKEYLLPVYVDAKSRRSAIEKFEQEARVLLSLNHPNIVKLDDCFVEDHRAYMVLEYIEGTTLKKKVETEGPIIEAQAIIYAIKFCEILQYLHERTPPLVHRDFTPDNLMIRPNGSVKLIDFTVADQSAGDTVTACIVGKQSYMPPEQFKGKPGPQSDLYALGATLYFMVIGQDPEPLECLHPVLEQEKLSSEFDLIVARCTELEVSKRYHFAREVKADLENLLTSRTL